MSCLCFQEFSDISRLRRKVDGPFDRKFVKAMSCITCHSPHAGKGKLKKVTKDACIKCHDASFTVEMYMPNTGQTAGNLFMRTHTFGKNPRKGGAGVGDMGPVNYYE